MKKLKAAVTNTAVAVASLACLSNAHAAPMSPRSNDMASRFSVQTQQDFVLLGDTDDPKLVYYVSTHGGIAVDAPSSAAPIPRFNIFSYTPTFGFWAGEQLDSMGGSFATASDVTAMNKLSSEAAAKGLHLAPAPATHAKVVFSSLGTEINGRLDVQCTLDTETITKADGTSKTIKIPNCKVKGAPSDSTYDLDTNMMYKFNSLPVPNNTTTAQRIAFQAITLPAFDPELRTLMQFGGQWDAMLQGGVVWDVDTAQKTRQAKLEINWSSTFEKLTAYMQANYFGLAKAEARLFIQKLVSCKGNADQCGVHPQFLDANGHWTDTAPNDADFIKFVDEVQHNLEDELFNRVYTYTHGHLPDASQGGDGYFFTARANYEKLTLDTHEVRYVNWNPGNDVIHPTTILSISCLTGGFEEGKVNWNMDDAGCRALVGQK